MNYQDITNLYDIPQRYQIKKQKYFIDNDNKKYNVDGKHVLLKTTQIEIEVANILGKLFGGQINLIPVVLYPQRIQTPDYIVNNNKFDLKQINGNGKNTLDTAINKKKNQSNNFIFDISKSEMKIEQAIIQIDKIYNANNRKWIDIIILMKDKRILKIFKRQ